MCRFLRTTRVFDLHLPASYVFLHHDRSASKERYQAMAARLDHPAIVECDGSHEAMLTLPDAVANALRAAIEFDMEGTKRGSATGMPRHR
jgi:hypothetical protein